ncbi:MAG: hypothetical protein H6Q00_1635 [Holophagaceae bacterium]|nr:hypothetical protein [Holophagaceae bacterium]
MKRLILPLACLMVLAATPAKAQVSVHIDLGLPIAPPLVVIQPGVQVVEGFHDEVFFSSGWYWCRRPDGWYRARSPRDRFSWVERHRVPRPLVRMPEGRYRNWRHEEHRPQMGHDVRHMPPGQVRKEERRDRKEERRENKRERKEDRRDDRRDRDSDHGRH